MRYVFKPGDRLTVKIGTEFIHLKVVADNPSIPPTDICNDCFFDPYDPKDGCETQMCALFRNSYHYELDNLTPTDDERH